MQFFPILDKSRVYTEKDKIKGACLVLTAKSRDELPATFDTAADWNSEKFTALFIYGTMFTDEKDIVKLAEDAVPYCDTSCRTAFLWGDNPSRNTVLDLPENGTFTNHSVTFSLAPGLTMTLGVTAVTIDSLDAWLTFASNPISFMYTYGVTSIDSVTFYIGGANGGRITFNTVIKREDFQNYVNCDFSLVYAGKASDEVIMLPLFDAAGVPVNVYCNYVILPWDLSNCAVYLDPKNAGYQNIGW